MIQRKNEYYPMEILMEEKVIFEFHSEARYTTDVIFQQSSRPAGCISENKKCFSWKQHLYGIKTEVSVLLNGIAIGCSDTFPGFKTDNSSFEKELIGKNLRLKMTRMMAQVYWTVAIYVKNFHLVGSFLQTNAIQIWWRKFEL